MLGIDKVLVIYCDYGRLGNRLHTHANALAWCIENNYNLINLSFIEYARLLKNSPRHKSGNLQQTNSRKEMTVQQLQCQLVNLTNERDAANRKSHKLTKIMARHRAKHKAELSQERQRITIPSAPSTMKKLKH